MRQELNEIKEQYENKNICEGCEGCDESGKCCNQYCDTLQNQYVHLENYIDTTPVEYVYSKKFIEEKSEDNTNNVDFTKSYVLEDSSLHKEINVTVETVEWLENENKNNSIEKKIN
jgi:DNA-binding XRE family transcriptional regulator